MTKKCRYKKERGHAPESSDDLEEEEAKEPRSLSGRERRKQRAHVQTTSCETSKDAKLDRVEDLVGSSTAPASQLDYSTGDQVEVIADGCGDRLDAWLTKRLSITRTRVTRACKAGCVLVDGLACKPSQKLKSGQLIRFSEPESPPLRVEPEDLSLPEFILFEDNHVIVLNKPPGMAVHPAGGLVSGTLVNGLLHHWGHEAIELIVPRSDETCAHDAAESDGDPDADELAKTEALDTGSAKELRNGVVRPGIVHRLDRFTSGVMVVAKDKTTHAHLHAQFAAKTTERVYEAIVCADPAGLAESGTVSGKIARDTMDRLRMAVVPDDERRGRHAITHFKRVETFIRGHAAILELQLETGRTHQIRIHCSAALDAPLLGDDVYGGAETGGTGAGSASKLSAAARRVPLEVRGRMRRQALHARTLGFTHPATQERMHFEAPLPSDFVQTVLLLRELEQQVPEGNDTTARPEVVRGRRGAGKQGRR